jgi:hypothetical protein
MSKGAKNEMRDEAVSPRRRQRRLHRGAATLLIAASAALALAAVGAGPAMAAEFSLNNFDVTFTNEDGTPATQAGSHPFAMDTRFQIDNTEAGPSRWEPNGQIKDDLFQQVPGFIGDATAIPRCSAVDFAVSFYSECPTDTQVGVIAVGLVSPTTWAGSPVYLLSPPPGVSVRFGFAVAQVRIVVDVGVKQSGDYNVTASQTNLSQILPVLGARLQLWGDPQSPAHDHFRSERKNEAQNFECWLAGVSGGDVSEVEFQPAPAGCSANVKNPKPFLTLPGSCTGPALSIYKADSWENPGVWDEGSALTHDFATPPNPQGFTGCGKLGFTPGVDSKPTTASAETPTGLDFGIDFNQEGLTNPTGLAQSEIKKAVIKLPEGMSLNPSVAEGLGVCSEEDLAREKIDTAPGAGCPNSSKIGTVEVETPLIDESVAGSVYLAQQNANPFHSLIALYIVLRNANQGILIKLPAKVEPDLKTGQVVTIVEDIPQVPFSHFRFHFREGQRSPLSSPPACGSFKTVAELTPWSEPSNPLTVASAFQITGGANGGACPTGATPPFHPGLDAGTQSNAAGSYSPFYVRLTRNDGEQEFTHFSIKLPPGIVGKLAGIPFCSNAAIEAAKSRTGTEEIASPSCPAASEVGHTLVGAGVGPALTYAPGKVYLAGPYNGSALSIAAITAAKVGPFDVGTVVVREALKINPETAEVFIDATGSDPIPHIIQGVVVHARDIRVYVDKPEFVLNPTNCERTSTASTVLGSGLNFASDIDDQPITVTSPFQAADCGSLGFAPKLDLSLKGSTKRGGTPKFKAVLTARKGDANIGEAQVTLPHSEFLEQAHIKTICTRVQFKEGVVPGEKCPAASVYGYAKATTPLLDEPLQGPVYLRSSSHNLPDLVAALNSGKINIALAGHIDSVKGGRIRNTFEAVPDAPVTKFTLEMQGGKKGLLVNSTNLCKSTNRAISHFIGQNGKVYDTKPVLKADCKKAKKQKKNKRAARSAAR